MAYKGKRISNPVTNQTIEFIATSEETRGEQLEMLATWEPHSMKPAAHYHPYQDEIFKVLEGELTLILNGKTNLLHRGDSVHIPAKAVHAMWNNSKEKTVVGKGYVQNTTTTPEKIQIKAIEIAKQRGADAILIKDYLVPYTGVNTRVRTDTLEKAVINVGNTIVRHGSSPEFVVLFLKYTE